MITELRGWRRRGLGPERAGTGAGRKAGAERGPERSGDRSGAGTGAERGPERSGDRSGAGTGAERDRNGAGLLGSRSSLLAGYPVRSGSGRRLSG